VAAALFGAAESEVGYPSNTGELHGKLGPGSRDPLDTSYLHLCYTPDMEVALALGVPQLLARGLEAREDSSQGAHGQVGQPQLDHVAILDLGAHLRLVWTV